MILICELNTGRIHITTLQKNYTKEKSYSIELNFICVMLQFALLLNFSPHNFYLFLSILFHCFLTAVMFELILTVTYEAW
jgi:hypothetical protein